ncbi:hypothetical protein [Actinomadura sp. BRA 177]|uniref:hypothetical protein n=1 Tax=Actinomadura sp. BRA 177 TaxID=2745202 RepID=UPI0015950CE7|nr:hypothetical protein [Actinomadura sp. BRA 177]NVI88442.1 hypothetical protein [Actinomadura sp. BRA 177]
MPDLEEHEYLRRLELLCRELVDHADDEGWLSYLDEPESATPLQRTVNEIARTLLHYHFEGDGCVDERPLLPLGGAALIRSSGYYADICALLGVETRPEGWALWHTWDDKKRATTLVTTCLTTTEGLLSNWARRIPANPATPDRAHIAAVLRGWYGPVVYSPDYSDRLGLGGA